MLKACGTLDGNEVAGGNVQNGMREFNDVL